MKLTWTKKNSHSAKFVHVYESTDYNFVFDMNNLGIYKKDGTCVCVLNVSSNLAFGLTPYTGSEHADLIAADIEEITMNKPAFENWEFVYPGGFRKAFSNCVIVCSEEYIGIYIEDPYEHGVQPVFTLDYRNDAAPQIKLFASMGLITEDEISFIEVSILEAADYFENQEKWVMECGSLLYPDGILIHMKGDLTRKIEVPFALFEGAPSKCHEQLAELAEIIKVKLEEMSK